MPLEITDPAARNVLLMLVTIGVLLLVVFYICLFTLVLRAPGWMTRIERAAHEANATLDGISSKLNRLNAARSAADADAAASGAVEPDDDVAQFQAWRRARRG